MRTSRRGPEFLPCGVPRFRRATVGRRSRSLRESFESGPRRLFLEGLGIEAMEIREDIVEAFLGFWGWFQVTSATR